MRVQYIHPTNQKALTLTDLPTALSLFLFDPVISRPCEGDVGLACPTKLIYPASPDISKTFHHQTSLNVQGRTCIYHKKPPKTAT